MKKSGFTLAEILIVLAIIGVVAAITLPGLLTDTTSAQIGPKLAKAVSMFEQGNEALLNAESSDSLSDAGVIDNASAYGNSLSNYLKISPFTYPTGTAQTATHSIAKAVCSLTGEYSKATPFISKDGMLYLISLNADEKGAVTIGAGTTPHRQLLGNVYVDINGARRPNAVGTDIFAFTLWNDGSLRPVGGANWNEASGQCTWQTNCPNGAVPTDYYACTGAIFENNLKALYK